MGSGQERRLGEDMGGRAVESSSVFWDWVWWGLFGDGLEGQTAEESVCPEQR